MVWKFPVKLNFPKRADIIEFPQSKPFNQKYQKENQI